MTRLRRPRFLQRLYAWLHAYFWLPCPVCGRKFGGHEWELTNIIWPADSSPMGKGVCSRECMERFG